MDSYSDLVDSIQNHPILANRVKQDALYSKNSLQLLSRDWEATLKGSKFFRNFQTDSKNFFQRPIYNPDYTIQYLNSDVPTVFVVGKCRFGKPYKNQMLPNASLLFSNCEPLIQIARVMTSDMDPQRNISAELKFQLKPCSILHCNVCRTQAEAFKSAGYEINKISQACIADTKVFDGQNIFNRFESQLETIFPQTFYAIVELKINSRYCYRASNNEMYWRIGGQVLDLIGFQMNQLNTHAKKVCLGDVVGPLENNNTSHPPRGAEVDEAGCASDFIQNVWTWNDFQKNSETIESNDRVTSVFDIIPENKKEGCEDDSLFDTIVENKSNKDSVKTGARDILKDEFHFEIPNDTSTFYLEEDYSEAII